MKKLVIFDLDGVLLDSEEVAAQFLAQQYPSITVEEQKELLAGNYHDEVEKYRQKQGANFFNEEELKVRRVEYTKRKLLVPMFDKAKDLLHELHDNQCIIALNTSARDRNSLPLLENHGVLDLFDFLGTADVSKSKVEKFKIIKEKYNLLNEDVLFVTDTLGDLREADLAEVPTVCVTWGAHDRSYFLRESHKNLLKIVDTIEELKEVILS